MSLVDEPIVELIQTWGSDLTTVNSARVSFGKRVEAMREQDVKLVKYLAKHEHTTPFRHAGATFCITCPIFVARQIHKHQVGISINEMSGRYVEFDPDDWWYPDVWRKQAESVKQGSSDTGVHDQSLADELYSKSVVLAVESYLAMLEEGVCKEQARAVLPQAMLTQFWMSGTLLAWSHFYKLRSDDHAQAEIREYATEIGNHMRTAFSYSWEELVK